MGGGVICRCPGNVTKVPESREFDCWSLPAATGKTSATTPPHCIWSAHGDHGKLLLLPPPHWIWSAPGDHGNVPGAPPPKNKNPGCAVDSNIVRMMPVHGLSVYPVWVCTGQSSHSERASAESQSSAVTPQFNLSFSFVYRFSKHLIEFIAIDS